MPDRRYRHWTNPGDGVWRCLGGNGCEQSISGRAFRGPTQETVRRDDIAVACPTCASKRVIYVRTIERVPA